MTRLRNAATVTSLAASASVIGPAADADYNIGSYGGALANDRYYPVTPREPVQLTN